MISLKVRCTTCNERFADVATNPCVTCGARTWEPCVHNSTPDASVAGIHLHPSGAAFFAYEEAAKAGAPVPAWAAASVPAASAAGRRAQLDTRLVQSIAANATYLALASPSSAQNTAQIKALTRQVNAMLRLQRGVLDAVD